MVGGYYDPTGPSTEGGFDDETAERNDVDALVLLCGTNDCNQNELGKWDALPHEEIGDNAEDGKDGEHDGSGGVASHPEVDTEGDIAECGEEERCLEDELGKGSYEQDVDEGENEGDTTADHEHDDGLAIERIASNVAPTNRDINTGI